MILIEVTEKGKPVTFARDKFVWLEAMGYSGNPVPEDPNPPQPGRCRIITTAGIITPDQTYDQVLMALQAWPKYRSANMASSGMGDGADIREFPTLVKVHQSDAEKPGQP